MSNLQTRVVLTEPQLVEIEDLAPTEPILAIVTAWQCIHPDWDHASVVNPTEWAIPKEQWERICSALSKFRSPDHPGLAGATAALEWVNRGPSAYDPE